MDFYRTQDNYILRKGEHSLWCNRVNGNLKIRHACLIKDLQIEPECSGRVHGIVGKIQFLPGSDSKLVLITKHCKVGELKDGSNIYRIDKIAVVPLSAELCPEIDLDPCEEHKDHYSPKQTASEAQPRMTQTFNNFKTSLANQFKGSTKTNIQKTTEKDGREKEKLEKLERRLQEEFIKMFSDSASFFYSKDGDLTNTLQRNAKKSDESRKLPIWKMADKRFFWNKAMLEEIISLTEMNVNANDWVIPIIQGYVQTGKCEVDFKDMALLAHIAPERFDLTLISRRSVTRAGTRYKRRGIDEDGHVANYVETEQIVCAGAHHLSFVQVRGSIPLHWSQAGIKYRPPPKLEKSKEDSQLAMKKHFEKELALYRNLIIINLVDQAGREQIIGDALMEHIISYNNALLTYVTFDFHEYCRGMKFENVSILVERLAEITEDIRYCWEDTHGIICEQRGVFRVNCMDCLDRTNVVQASLARCVLESQLRKLGRLMPEQSLPPDARDIYQDIWANNGDAISRQYAGTAAMKGDFTRTGERRFTGVMKDGYHSANRYLNRFTAAYRQTVIDLMLGITPTEDISLLIAAMKQPDDSGEEWTMQREEWVAHLVENCQRLLVNEGEHYLGGWALVEPFISFDEEGGDLESESVLLLTEDAFYVACYDEERECVGQYERQALENLEKIEIGPDSSSRTHHCYLRLHYRSQGDGGYFHTFKALQNLTGDEGGAVLRGIADEFHKTCEGMKLQPKIYEGRLSRKKSKRHNTTQISSKTRPFSAEESRSGKNIVTAKNTLLQDSSLVHSSSAPAELNKFAASPPNSNDKIVNSCPKVLTSDEPKDESMETYDSVSEDDDQTSVEEQGEYNTEDDVSYDAGQVETTNTSIAGAFNGHEQVSTGRIDSEDDKQACGRTETLKQHSAALDDIKVGNPKATDFSSSISNLKQNLKNRFVDVSVKFQKSSNITEITDISWQNERDVEDTQEPARPTGKRNIFTAAQERGRTIIPDLKNRFSELSTRSPKSERRKNWEQEIMLRDCKTKIIQL